MKIAEKVRTPMFAFTDAIKASQLDVESTALLYTYWSYNDWTGTKAGTAYPSIETLAKETRLNERTVRRRINRVLIPGGWLVPVENSKTKSREFKLAIPDSQSGVSQTGVPQSTDSQSPTYRTHSPVHTGLTDPRSTHISTQDQRDAATPRFPGDFWEVSKTLPGEVREELRSTYEEWQQEKSPEEKLLLGKLLATYSEDLLEASGWFGLSSSQQFDVCSKSRSKSTVGIKPKSPGLDWFEHHFNIAEPLAYVLWFAIFGEEAK